ncbi:glycosyltransferase [Deinococcus ficus]|uniref:glycosyltransferase n=1 Tax=Deinococcus ficus TaxID=317577 RepID=UPI0017493C5D|nr:glycosyltransferase [Deinococcus ficus]GHF87510.1 glycosyl transferase [Deinococcus ficus]
MNYAIAYVVYNPTVEQIERINEISFGHPVYVYDNSETISELPYNKDIVLVRNGRNDGIAVGLNILLETASGDGRSHIITMDQDSLIDDHFIKKLISLAGVDDREIIVAPMHHTGDITYDKDLVGKSSQKLYVLTTMTSGNLLNVQFAIDVGKFEEKYFIDYVDHEFCLRANRKGYKVVISKDLKMEHSLGHSEQKFSLLSLEFVPTFHAPVRRIYMTRNRSDVWRKYFAIYPRWVLRDFMRFNKELLGIVVFEDNKLIKVYSIVAGFYLFIMNRWGKAELRYLVNGAKK